MTPALQQETEKLVRSWMRHDQAALRDYLVAEVEDPRINVQSLIARQFLLTEACGDRFKQLMDEELRFAVMVNWLLQLARNAVTADDLVAVLDGLRRRADDAEGVEIPPFIARVFQRLPTTADGVAVPNYLEAFLQAGGVAASQLDLFMDLWRARLASETPPEPRPTVLEAACGSANDYRFLRACGVTRLVDYSGFDLCEKNIANARAMFPDAAFAVGNVFSLTAPDQSVDFVMAHDLFEHLSPAGIETAVAEFTRVARQGLCLSFFNMDEVPEDTVRPTEEYHWNTLSVERMRERFAAQGFAAQVVHIGSFLRWATGCDRTHNPRAYTFLLRR